MAQKKELSNLEKLKKLAGDLFGPRTVFLIATIIVLLLVAYFYPSENKQEKPSPQQEKLQENSKLENAEETLSPQTHIVTPGESLSKIAQKYYGDKEKWTILALENKIENPDLIHIGSEIKIPDLEKQTSSISTQKSNQEEVGDYENGNQTYTVVNGDTLWEISQQFYGTGYLWYKIRDANSEKVGLLHNGRPLIIPDTVLFIPTL